MRSNKAYETYEESQFSWLLLLLALLINILLLFVIFFISLDNNWNFSAIEQREQPSAPVVFEDMPTPEQPAQPELKTDEVAALKSGASNFGMPDEFKEDEFVAAIPDEQPEKPQLEEPELIDTQEINNKPEEKPQQDINPPLEPEILTTQHEKSYETIKAQPIPTPLPPEVKQLPITHPLPQEKKIVKKETPPLPQQPTKIRAPLQKELTFNDLAKGFLSSLDEGGNDLMDRKGNENIRPDFEEMRYLSYLHKIIWYMQNEWRRDNDLGNCAPPVMSVTGVSVTIDKDGILKNAKVIQSCGNYKLDEVILRGIRAVGSYPPLPTYLKKDVMTFEFGVKHVGISSPRSSFHMR